MDKYVDLERELWFELGNCMWRKHRNVYQDHMKYVRNDIFKPFKVKNFRYTKCVCGMHDLAKYLPPPLVKVKSSEAANWTVRNQEFIAVEVRLAIKDGLPKSMQDELDDHIEYYRFLTYEDWCDLLSIIEVKDERKSSAV